MTIEKAVVAKNFAIPLINVILYHLNGTQTVIDNQFITHILHSNMLCQFFIVVEVRIPTHVVKAI